MAARKVVNTFVNRNPRNIEFLKLKPKPTGWVFEKDRDQHNFLYKVVLQTTKNSTEGLLIHHEDGVVLRASTREPSINKQLYSMIDTSAAMNIGRVLAKRCVGSGIVNCIPNVTADEIERSKRKTAFFNALRENGVKLFEEDAVKHSFINDPNFTWPDSMVIQHNRQDKLDELDLRMPY